MKKECRWLMLIFPVAAIVLEALPYGAVLNFCNGNGETIRETFSYFSLIPFGYANFAPLITAVLSCVLLILSVVFVFKPCDGLKKAIIIIGIIAGVVSLIPLLKIFLGGVKNFSIVGLFIFLILFVHILLSVALSKSKK